MRGANSSSPPTPIYSVCMRTFFALVLSEVKLKAQTELSTTRQNTKRERSEYRHYYYLSEHK